MGSRGAHCTVAHEVEHIHVHSDTDWRWDGAIVGCPVKAASLAHCANGIAAHMQWML